ncbi:hypothetical protein [Rahnella sp. CJA17(1/100)]|uniref:hypothetical protein n=1 Tax=Rahnella sp. CJA17(1/100) TaxID=2508951 RepID=UPI0010704EC3|nr:hypothetical protein [Rahnella sp. CJA17(1/100)]
MNFQKTRVDIHNNYPEKILFKAELEFIKRLEDKGLNVIFSPIKLQYDEDASFQVYLSHYIDGLNTLPFRPDQTFDNNFKVIDDAGRAIFPRGGTKKVLEELSNKLSINQNLDWQNIIDILTENIPLMTCRYITKNIFEAHKDNSFEGRKFQDRIEKCLGKVEYAQLLNQFPSTPTPASSPTSLEHLKSASSFMRLYLKGKKTSQSNKCYPSKLDLSKASNVLSHAKRFDILISLFLYTMRNERAHGASISPFITSKSTFKRYESYYFAMLCSYIFSLGVLSLRGFAGLNSSNILDCCRENVKIQKHFFNS